MYDPENPLDINPKATTAWVYLVARMALIVLLVAGGQRLIRSQTRDNTPKPNSGAVDSSFYLSEKSAYMDGLMVYLAPLSSSADAFTLYTMELEGRQLTPAEKVELLRLEQKVIDAATRLYAWTPPELFRYEQTILVSSERDVVDAVKGFSRALISGNLDAAREHVDEYNMAITAVNAWLDEQYADLPHKFETATSSG